MNTCTNSSARIQMFQVSTQFIPELLFACSGYSFGGYFEGWNHLLDWTSCPEIPDYRSPHHFYSAKTPDFYYHEWCSS